MAMTLLSRPSPINFTLGLPKKRCISCKGTGWAVEFRQGDPVPEAPGIVWAETTYLECTCTGRRSS